MSTMMPPRKRARLPPSSSSSQRSSTSRSSGTRQGLLERRFKERSTRASRTPSSTTSHTPTPPRNLARAAPPRTSSPLPENESEIVRREQADVLEEVVLALDMRGGARGAMGACYYVARDEKLCIMGDVQMASVETVEMIKLQVQPTVILVTSRIDESVEDCLDPEHHTRGSSESNYSQFRLPYIFETRPSNEYNYEAGIQRLIGLSLSQSAFPHVKFIVPGHEDPYESHDGSIEPGFTSRQEKLLRLTSLVDVESRLAIGCAGAVLACLHRRRAAMFLPGDTDAEMSMRVTSLEMVALDGFMLLNSDTLSSLQIFQLESHPNSYNQGPSASGAKEDLSIYGLFHHLAKTPQGKRLLRQWFSRPSLDLKEIIERQDTASIFLRPENEMRMEEVVNDLKPIKNMRTVMLHLRKGMNDRPNKAGGIKNGVWATIRSFAFHTIGIYTVVEQFLEGRQLAIITKILGTFEKGSLSMLGTLVTGTVDFSASAETHRTVINPGVSEELDRMKREYDGMESLLSEVSRRIAATIPQVYGLDLNVAFFPQIGFLICMPIFENTGRAQWEGGPNAGEAWEKIFSTEERVYYKDNRMNELDATFGDVYANICDKEIEIMHDLAQQVLEFENMLCAISDICGELDALLALAQGAKLYRLARPSVDMGNGIHISEGRHLLQELTVPSYIANDTQLAGALDPDSPPDALRLEASSSEPRMLVMTGPNYSGKSVYMKQVAQIVYLAHIGCFVPAAQATIGLTDMILTRVATRESVSRPHSSFAIDLQQIASALNLATRRTLLIVDEFGKGTDATDGAGLVCGVLKHLLNYETRRQPKVLAATHFHEIFEAGFLKPQPGLAFAHMDVHVDQEAVGAEEQVTYLYSLQPGRSLASFGTICAALNGVDQAVVKRAEDLIELDARGGDLVAAFCSNSRPSSAKRDGSTETQEEWEQWNAVEEIARAFLAKDFSLPAPPQTGAAPNGGDDDQMRSDDQMQEFIVVEDESEEEDLKSFLNQLV